MTSKGYILLNPELHADRRLHRDTTVKRRRLSFISTLATIFFATFLAFAWILVCLYSPGNSDANNKNSTQSDTSQCTNVPDTERHDCWPQVAGASRDRCEAKGCCWNVAGRKSSRLGNVPWCYYPKDFSLYTVTNLQKSDTGYMVQLSLTQNSGWPNDINKLALSVMFDTSTRLRFKFYDPNNNRYEVPIQMNPVSEPVATDTTDYSVDIPSQGPFYITVTRKSTGNILTNGAAPLVFSDQFIQIGTQLSSQYIYGLGEHRGKFLQDTNWSKMVMWARDRPPVPNTNLYGDHSFFLNVESDKNVHGVFLLNSNAMGVELSPAPALTYMTTGGVLDFYVFMGPFGDNVVEQYTGLIGRPFMPPYWSLGYHQCRWGYGGVAGMKKVIQRMRNASMPFDTIWNDIDYMREHLDWTYNFAGEFHELPDVVKDVHDHGQHYIMIVDPGISNKQKRGTYPPYDDGISQDVFIKTSDGSAPIVGSVWPGKTVFPDFFHPNAQGYWTNLAHTYHDTIPYDGIWIDMNEPSNFDSGSTTGCPNNTLENPPYVPVGIDGGSLRAKTLCASAKQSISTHYNLHSLYGYSEAKVTKGVRVINSLDPDKTPCYAVSHQDPNGLQRALDTILGGKRSIVISRSTFPGSGVYTGHWTGDNRATWEDMYYSITGILNFQLFGIPLVGADICGFGGNTNPELCARWMQLGAFYPFMRNHNMLGAKDQDPAVFDKDTQKIMRDALNLRYTLLPYLYTMFYRSHVDGTPIVRPLFFQYPQASVTYSSDVQFMWGTGLLVTPTTSSNTIKGQGYLPQDRWYDFYNNSYIDSPGHFIMFDLPMERINVQIRGGTIIPIQAPNITTTAARKGNFTLLVALAPDTSANGELFWDDGESQDSINSENYNLIHFYSSKDVLSSTVIKSDYRAEPMILSDLTLQGVEVAPTSVTLNGKVISPSDYTYKNKVIYLHNQYIDLLQQFSIAWLV